MQAHRTNAVVSEDGSLTVEKLPFPPGEAVEVVVFPATGNPAREKRYPLRGTPIQFDNPTEPIGDSNVG